MTTYEQLNTEIQKAILFMQRAMHPIDIGTRLVDLLEARKAVDTALDVAEVLLDEQRN